jgi:uncharacterized protein (UPF0276 family)
MGAETFHPPKLGVGMIFAPALRPFLERRPRALDLLEIEPQTLWLADDAFAGPFYEYTPGIALFAALPGHKLVHSVGMPLGGTRPPDPAQCALIAATADRLGSPWVSEHLSVAGTPHRAAGFLLPPLQTEQGVATATANISAFAAAVGRPVAVETGVAYLRRKPFEMEDGAFLSQVVDEAGCGILLDLHNLYCNARNGRIRLDEYLSEIPLDRVWEVHLAGGAERDGFWLDSHSGPMPDDLAALARDVLSGLRELGALNFEIYDTYLARTTEEDFDRIVEELHELWDGAGQARGDALPRAARLHDSGPAPDSATWEAALTEAVWRAEPELHPWPEDEAALKLYAWLARSFRGSMLARTLPRAVRYLLLRDRDAIDATFEAYFAAVPPQLYGPLEAEAFAKWLAPSIGQDQLLQALIDYDLALLRVVRTGAGQAVAFPGDPMSVFEALAEGRLPTCPEPPVWELEILPDGSSVADFSGSAPARS